MTLADLLAGEGSRDASGLRQEPSADEERPLMDMKTLHSVAAPLAMAGGLGTVSMALYKAALRRVDWDLIPASAMIRVRWWSNHASLVLRASLILAVLGLTVIAAT